MAELLAIYQRDHVATKADPARYAISVQHLLRFFDRERRLGRVIGGVTVADVNKALVGSFIAFRKGEGVGGHTISRDLAALRGALNHAYREELITAAPFIRDVDAKDKAKPRELVYTQEQVAGLLEAAWGRPERHHVFLYTMIQLSTCGRSEAILDLHDHQLRDGLIYFLDPDRDQTSKRRSVVPVAPTLAPWLEGISGKVIKYRAAIAEKNRQPDGPEYFERDCYDLGNAFDACLIEAGITRPVLDASGQPVMLTARRKLGETDARPKLRGRGTPNTLRHTAITEMHRRGVAEAQIEAAAGHAGEGTNKKNYRHLRPDYLAELIEAVDAYWSEMTRLTTVHLRSQCGPTVVSLAAARAGQRLKNG
ncbi:phage integrase SAM-like domain-containing protein [Sphingomonas sp. 1P06PA]|uniref:tyrosine-type recombinase/integrase n=1 Tax=Sphingomonas sp. 1P06PA TaxID=554121 RepID=UPI0039A6E271